MVEPVGLEPTLGFLPLIKSQVSAIQFEYDSIYVGGLPENRTPFRGLRIHCFAHLSLRPLKYVV